MRPAPPVCLCMHAKSAPVARPMPPHAPPFLKSARTNDRQPACNRTWTKGTRNRLPLACLHGVAEGVVV